MDTDLGWKEAIVTVLKSAGGPMHHVQIAEQVYSRGLRTEPTATPAATVTATIGQSVRNDGDQSPSRESAVASTLSGMFWQRVPGNHARRLGGGLGGG